MVPKKRRESRAHLSSTERLPDLLAQANRHYWYKLLVDADDRAVLDHELGKLKRSPNPNVHQIYNVLAASKVQHAIGQRNATWLTEGRAWFKRRARLLKDAEALRNRFLQLYGVFSPGLKIPLKASGQLPPNLYSGAENTIQALDRLLAAIKEDPVLNIRSGGRGRGNQPETHKQTALAQLRKLGITKERAVTLLKLIGVKPPLSAA